MATLNSYEGLLPTQPLNQAEQPIMAGPQPSPRRSPRSSPLSAPSPNSTASPRRSTPGLRPTATSASAPTAPSSSATTTPPDNMNFILRGEVQVRRRHAGNVALFIGRAGSMTGKLPFSRMKNYGGDGFAVGPVWSLDIPDTLFPEMLAAIPSMAQRCVSVLLDRVREVTRMEQQSEKLNALGKLAANLAHELNNPASAAQRSAASLFGELREYGDQKYRLGNLCLSEQEIAGYRAWVQNARARMSAFSSHSQGPQSPLAVTDREEALVRWLEAHNVPEPWTIAPALSETNLTIDLLDELAAITRPEVLPVAVATVASSLRVERMAETVVDSTVRIFDLISAIKDYSYMDQAPIQDVDLAQSLENTLAMFNSRLKNVTVELQLRPRPPARQRLRQRTQPGLDRPDRKRPREHERHGNPAAHHPPQRLHGAASRSGTTAPASTPPSAPASSSRSSPPRPPAAASASAWTPSSASSASTPASSPSNPSPAPPASRYAFPSTRRRPTEQ